MSSSSGNEWSRSDSSSSSDPISDSTSSSIDHGPHTITCPICGKGLDDMSTNQKNTHVSKCLDLASGTPAPVVVPARPWKTTPSTTVSGTIFDPPPSTSNSGFGLPCPYPNCGKTYEASDFTTHVKARHTQDAQTFACPLCTLLGLHYAVTPQTNLVQHLQHGHADLWNAPVTLIASKPSSPPVTSNTRVNLVHVHRPPVPSRLPVQVAKDEKLEPETTGKVEITVVPKKEKSPKSSRHDSEGSAKSPKDEKASRRSDSKDKSEKGSTTPNSKEKRTRKVSRSDPHVRREKHSDKSHDDNNIKVTLTKSDITTGEKKIKRKTQEKKTSREHKGGRRHSTPNQDSKLDTTTTTTTATFTSTTSTPATPPTSPSPTGPLMTTPTVSSSGDYLTTSECYNKTCLKLTLSLSLNMFTRFGPRLWHLL